MNATPMPGDSRLSKEKAEEEAKRERILSANPTLRWQMIQAAINFALANLPPEQQRNRPRVHAWWKENP